MTNTPPDNHIDTSALTTADSGIVNTSNPVMPRSNVSKAKKQAVYQTVYSPDHCEQTEFLPGNNNTLYRTDDPLKQPALPRSAANGEINWLHFVGITNAELLKHLLMPYGIHELVIEDILSKHQRPKVDDYGHYIFIAARVYEYSNSKLQSDQIYLILSEDFVFTFQQNPLGLFSSIREQMANANYDLRHKNAAFLAYRCIDRLIDDYFITIDQYDKQVETIDKILFADTAKNSDILSKIHRLKRDAVRLRRTLEPLRDALAQLVHGDSSIFHGESHIYLRDAYDHTLQLIESLNASRDMVMSMMDIHLSFQSNRLNLQMRVLTVITIIFMPLTLLTGIYGMNFEYMPELHWHYGYFMVLFIMAVVIVSLLIFFYRRKWL